MTWTQPICSRCWEQQQPDRIPLRLKEQYVEVERCAFCGEETTSGIYVRADPKAVPYPAEEKA